MMPVRVGQRRRVGRRGRRAGGDGQPGIGDVDGPVIGRVAGGVAGGGAEGDGEVAGAGLVAGLVAGRPASVAGRGGERLQVAVDEAALAPRGRTRGPLVRRQGAELHDEAGIRVVLEGRDGVASQVAAQAGGAAADAGDGVRGGAVGGRAVGPLAGQRELPMVVAYATEDLAAAGELGRRRGARSAGNHHPGGGGIRNRSLLDGQPSGGARRPVVGDGVSDAGAPRRGRRHETGVGRPLDADAARGQGYPGLGVRGEPRGLPSADRQILAESRGQAINFLLGPGPLCRFLLGPGPLRRRVALGIRQFRQFLPQQGDQGDLGRGQRALGLGQHGAELRGQTLSRQRRLQFGLRRRPPPSAPGPASCACSPAPPDLPRRSPPASRSALSLKPSPSAVATKLSALVSRRPGMRSPVAPPSSPWTVSAKLFRAAVTAALRRRALLGGVAFL